jgi:nucleoside phosphorylase
VPRAVILTALQTEFAAVAKRIASARPVSHPTGAVYEVGVFEPKDAIHWTVAAAQIGMGNVNAALHTYGAIELIDPDLLLFVGVAGALKRELQFGDVIVGDRVVAYERGKSDSEGFHPRGTVQTPHPRVIGHARWLANHKSWLRRRSKVSRPTQPNVYVASIAAGEKVLASEKAEAASIISEFYSDAYAVEMEGYGVYEAARTLDVDALVIRSISDHLLDKSANADAIWQPIAADLAASFAFELLATFRPRGDGDQQDWEPSFPPESRTFTRVPVAARSVAIGNWSELGNPPPDPWPLQRGLILDGRYRIESEIGRGALGSVYRATEIVADQDIGEVAVKIYHRSETADEMWLQEVRILSQIRDPYIANYRTAGEISLGGHRRGNFVVTDLGSATLQQARPFGADSSDVSTVAIKLLSALRSIHSAGFVHGDIKPANILVSGDLTQLTLIDFGAAGPIGSEPVAVTLAFSAPELLAGAVRSVASDTYSAGVTLIAFASGVSHEATRARTTDVEAVLGGTAPIEVPSELEERVANVLTAMVAADPLERIDLARAIDLLSDDS